MKRVVRAAGLAVGLWGLVPLSVLAAGPATPAVLPINALLPIAAPPDPANPSAMPKRLRQYYLQSMPYLAVAQFTVTPGQKYTLYECHPAPADSGTGTKISVWTAGVTPLSDNASAFGRSAGVMRGFVTRGQSPWPITAKEGVACDRYRHNFVIAPDSEHASLFVIAAFSKPGLSTQVMLKHPADPDDDVKTSQPRSRGSVWNDPLLLLNIPGEKSMAAGGASQPPTPGAQLPASVSASATPTPHSTASLPARPQDGREIRIPDAPVTASAAYPPLAYPSRIRAHIHRGDYDTFPVEFPGGTLRVASQGGLDIVADLWDDKGSRLARDGEDGRADLVIEKEVPPGLYYVQVRYMRHAGEGPYSLVLGDGSGPVYQEQ
jgi:hypothetical protein